MRRLKPSAQSAEPSALGWIRSSAMPAVVVVSGCQCMMRPTCSISSWARLILLIASASLPSTPGRAAVTTGAFAVAACWLFVAFDTRGDREGCEAITYVHVFGPAILLACSVGLILIVLFVSSLRSRESAKVPN